MTRKLLFFSLLGIGRLMVVLRESQEDTIIFEKVGDQGNRWIKALVDIGRVASHFKVMILDQKCIKHFVSSFKSDSQSFSSSDRIFYALCNNHFYYQCHYSFK